VVDGEGAVRRVDLDCLATREAPRVHRGMARGELELLHAGLDRLEPELGPGAGTDESARTDLEL